MRTGTNLLCIGCAIVLARASIASAVPINYGDFLGAAVGDVDFLQVIEDSTTDATPRYGAPTPVTNQLSFSPSAFGASSANGASDTTDGVLTMTLRADAGYFLENITVMETGDYTLSGVGQGGTLVDIVGMISVEDIAPGTNGSMNEPLIFSPVPPFGLPSTFDLFSGTATIDLSGLGISEVTLTLDTFLEATSELGTTSLIQAKAINIQATSTLIPEPSSLALLALGAVLPIRRRRRRQFAARRPCR